MHEWHRRRDEDGDVYYVEKRGRYMIDKKVTDDRDFDGGYFNVEWILHGYDAASHSAGAGHTSGFSPISSHRTLAAAKSAAA